MTWRSKVFAVVGILGLAASASAGTITGHVNMSGSFIYDTQGAGTGLAIVNYDDGGITPVGTGLVIELTGQTGFFENGCVGTCLGGNGLTATTTAVILDITNDPTPTTPAVLVPFPGATFLANWISAFSDLDAAGLHFDLTEILNQSGPACTAGMGVGSTCVEGPFVLNQTENGMHIQMDFLGNFVRGADSGAYIVQFTSDIPNMTFAILEDRLDNSGLPIACGTNNLATTCAAAFAFDPVATAIPEPASLLTFGAGAAILAGFRRRRAAKASKA